MNKIQQLTTRYAYETKKDMKARQQRERFRKIN